MSEFAAAEFAAAEFAAAAAEATQAAARDFHLTRDITAAKTDFSRELHKSFVGEGIYFNENECSFVTNGYLEKKELVDKKGTKYENVNMMPEEVFRDFLRSLPEDTQRKMMEYRNENPKSPILDAKKQEIARNKTTKAPQGPMQSNFDTLNTPEPQNMTPAEKKTWTDKFIDAANWIGAAIWKGIEKLKKLVKENKDAIKFVGKLFLLKYLTETTLNSMLAGSNGCWVVDAATGEQMYQISTEKDANKCKCEDTPNSGQIYQQCEIECRNVKGSAQNYGGCLGVSCNCKDTTGVVTAQNYNVKVVKDNCYTMFAKVLSATGLMVSDFVGTVEDGFYNITDGFKNALSNSWKIAIIIAIGVFVLGIAYLIFYFNNKRRNAKLAAVQPASSSTSINVSTSPSANPPGSSSLI